MGRTIPMLVSVSIFFIYNAAAQAGAVQETAPVFSLTISAPEATTVGSPMRLKLVLTNKSDHEISVFRDKRGGENQVEVRGEKGKLAKETEFGYARNGHADANQMPLKYLTGSGAWVPVKVGSSLTYDVQVSERYELIEAGTYTIWVQRFDDESKKTVKSNTITLKVLAK